MKDRFEILVNGIPRTFRDVEKNAIDAGRVLKDREKGAEITIIKHSNRQWLIITDPFAAPGPWHDPAGGPLRILE